MMMIKRLALMGSTGSIGQQSLEVVRQHPDNFVVNVLAANNCSNILISQAKEFRPKVVAIANEAHYPQLKAALDGLGIELVAGDKALAETCSLPEIDMVVAAIVGFAGLRPVVEALNSGKHIALANKETLVVAGEWVMNKAKKINVDILPIDSEHSAIFQCLEGEKLNPVEKIILTGSGGPFRGMNAEKLKNISPTDALRHPNWSMGPKITVDSASLMNKGLEVIEAKYLFNLDPSQIEVIIHPQSIIHSLVQFADGSIKAQMGLPDMRLPIQYALSYPQRLPSSFPRFDFMRYPSLTFEKPDTLTFRSLNLAYQALRKGGNMACILNAANEIAVHAFLNHYLPFLHIPRIIEQCMEKIPFLSAPCLSDLYETDRLTREFATSLIQT
ncbi:MAG: 1-deoxy-D-xylulose-5-phosphate reductoisomerase [Bacteroidales bacterium]|jgi:1-deoxy-D-xylulose-5-phosphate reductoisomerase|nr:1-deoxy-D-xylulose-5-phosphate reductoisomerase [Bacteroidales bacterium]